METTQHQSPWLSQYQAWPCTTLEGMMSDGPYFLEIDDRGCKTCSHGKSWMIVSLGGVGLGVSYENEEEASELCDQLNTAYNNGLASFEATLAEKDAEIAELTKKVKNLTAWYDKMFGTPCEEIRHQQQIEQVIERLGEDHRHQLTEKDAMIIELDTKLKKLCCDYGNLLMEKQQLHTELDRWMGRAVWAMESLECCPPYLLLDSALSRIQVFLKSRRARRGKIS